jgi:hypothetical protein
MKVATPTEEQRQWMRQWREAAVYLEEVKRDELANMTASQAWRSTDRLLALARFYRKRLRTSGLVKQQALFHRRNRRK